MDVPGVGSHLVVSIVADRTLLLRLNRPEKLNAMTRSLEEDLRKVLDWFEDEPRLWAVVVTGTGRVFCAGQDLKEALEQPVAERETFKERVKANPHGFGSLARRKSRKPIIAALNGSAYGGGAELLVNCDVIVGCKGAEIAFPEVRRGLVASVGGIPNLMLRSPNMAPWVLAGLPIPQHLLEAHVLTEVGERDEVLPRALKWAAELIECSPRAVQVTKQQINLFKEGKGVEEVVMESSELDGDVNEGPDFAEGLRAFAERRTPVWTNPPKRTSKL